MLWASRKASVLNHLQQAWAKMNSLYAQYIREVTTDHIIETEEGFVTYRYLNENKSVYIIDIFTLPKARKQGTAANLRDLVIVNAKRKYDCRELLGTVCLSNPGSTISLMIQLEYGMQLVSAQNGAIVLRKDI